MGEEGFVNVRSISRFCDCDFLRKLRFVKQRCNIVLREGQFLLAFYGVTVSEVDCKFSHGVTCIS